MQGDGSLLNMSLKLHYVLFVCDAVRFDTQVLPGLHLLAFETFSSNVKRRRKEKS